MTDEMSELLKQMLKLQQMTERMTGERKVTLFKDFAFEYLLEKINNPTLRAGTKKCFELQTRVHLIPAFGTLELDKITNAVWLTWVTKKREETEQAFGKPGRKGIRRFFNARKCLIEILLAAHERGLIDKKPKLDLPDAKMSVGRALEEKEILKIIWKSRRPFRVIFYAFWKMGCRPKEILSWEWSMFEFRDDGKVWINVPSRISKTDRMRSIPINPDLAKFLKRRQTNGNGSRFVFPGRSNTSAQNSYSSAWRRACAAAKVKAMPYDLRRSFITRCASEGKPLLYIAKLLDTSTKLIEEVYAKQNAELMEDIIK